jgi:hypothetical protein
MNGTAQSTLQPVATLTPFPAASRYFQIETATFQTPEETTIVYLRRRFVPSPDRFDLLFEHTVVQSDRLDNVTARYLGDPEQFWRVCDANCAMRPEELTETVGRHLRITLPEGIPGPPHA